jgi:excisionase family DNA binding protein
MKKPVAVQDPSQLFSIETVAGILFVSIATVRRFVKNGQIESVRVGDLHRFTREQIDSYIRRNSQRFGCAA